MSMFRQLWLAILASTLMALTGSLLVSMLSARSYLESQLSIKNTDNATALALSLSQSKPDDVMMELVVSSLFDGGHYEVVKVTNPQGQTVVERMSTEADLGAPAWFANLLPIHAQPGQAKISNGWSQLGVVTLVSQSRFAYEALWNSAKEMAVALVLAGLAGGVMSTLVLRRLRRPLNAVIDQAKSISQRRFVSIQEPEVPELRQLAAAMNTTVARLKSMFEEEAARLELVRREANFDSLTGLANRAHFMARLRQAVDAEESGGGLLLLIRMADLVGINRRLGRAATDEFLKIVGACVYQSALKNSSGVPARMNGADFAVLLPGEKAGMSAANELLKALQVVAAPYVALHETAWVGVGWFARGVDIGGLLSRVDSALASAEATGTNAIREAEADEDDEMPRTVDQWSTMIRRALDKKWAKLNAFPVLTLDGRLSHSECPLRLMFDERGEWLPAGRFLPFAERLKLTSALDLAAIRLGLDELRTNESLPGLAINLSASSLEDPSFHTRLLALIHEEKGLASRLWLEIAEGGAWQHLDAFRQLCKALKAAGCRTGLEHFGHHFSQIGYLHDLGLDYLKVDSSFIRGIDSNTGNASFLKGLCSIGHNIGLQVIAEGVSTRAEWDTLLLLGFDGVTGPVIQIT